jgi:hypothetical protein
MKKKQQGKEKVDQKTNPKRIPLESKWHPKS